MFPPVPPLLEKVIDMDLFGWAHDPKVPFIPLVDLWLDLEDHLSSDNIPSPTELWKEQETIGAIIERAMKRRAAAKLSSQAPPAAREDSLPAGHLEGQSPPEKESHAVTSTGHVAMFDYSPTGRRSPVNIHKCEEKARRGPLPSRPRELPPPTREPRRPSAHVGTPPRVSISGGPNSGATRRSRTIGVHNASRGGHKESEAKGGPNRPATFASLFKAVGPVGNRVATWTLRASSSKMEGPRNTDGQDVPESVGSIRPRTRR
ncbi:hypothetical protein L227DRAFT_602232 [Lentinus tigrinus ALCF2SS1-6]|uniref:Uncharacterized protein n=1 Tax=Lentinus tigrinus ALCF2SS1-6 TaxID=1328759 RepID=A0A5C2S361_9APHY|nr:hypothetical protein L227DRAFT_602232 [Lentinus tigrinus ALCF2SS1-6]